MTYDADGVSEPDFAYGYTDALLDHVCRPVTFHLIRRRDGVDVATAGGARADFTVGLPAAEAARRLRTALDPDGDWIAHVLRDAVLRLERIRAGDHPGRRRARRSPPTRSTPRRSPSGSSASPASGPSS